MSAWTSGDERIKKLHRKLWLLLVGVFMTGFIFVAAVDFMYLNPRDLRLSPYEYDQTMGWLPKRNFTRIFHQKDAGGNRYDADFSLDGNRFRAYGNAGSGKTRILFLGDSFTGDPFTGNREMYFSVVKSAFREKYGKDVEVFAVGGGGYGTIQEYLLVKDQIKTIKPDIFVLQFSDNDFFNNLMAWERKGIVRNQYLFRPYHSPGGRLQHVSSPFASCYRFLWNNSYLFRRADIVVQRLQYLYYGDYTKKLSREETEKFEKESYAVTRSVLNLLRQEFGRETQLFLMVDVTNDKHVDDMQVALAKETGFTPLLFPEGNVISYEANHKAAILRHADGGHLDILGNRILGEGLAEELNRYIGR